MTHPTVQCTWPGVCVAPDHLVETTTAYCSFHQFNHIHIPASWRFPMVEIQIDISYDHTF